MRLNELFSHLLNRHLNPSNSPHPRELVSAGFMQEIKSNASRMVVSLDINQPQFHTTDFGMNLLIWIFGKK